MIDSKKSENKFDIDDIKEPYDAANLLLSPSEDVLFFVNKNNGKLYGINL